MARVANNADTYAATRQNIFFTGVTPDLDGQCVSLEKWFLQEMTSVPNPQAARGNGKDVGRTLVNQGFAVEVPYDQRQRGDIICYEYGLYGHVGIVLSGNRTFEQNVNWSGVNSKIVDGARVYASRIGDLGESWRHDQHIYRVNSYTESGMDQDISAAQASAIYAEYGYNVPADSPACQGRKELELRTGIAAMVMDTQNQLKSESDRANGLSTELDAERKGYELQINSLQSQMDGMQKQVDDLNGKITELVKVNNVKDGEITRLTAENAALRAQIGDVNLSVKQAIRILFQTIKDAISGK